MLSRIARTAKARLGAAGRGAARLDLDYPVVARARWGYDSPPHPELHGLIEAGRSRYVDRLTGYLDLLDDLTAIAFDADGTEPHWVNPYFAGLDAVSLYGELVARRPATYVEVGAGHSTRFARSAVETHGLDTRIVSIDPAPRADLAGLTDEHVRAPLEDVDHSLFTSLVAGDVVMFDGSHRCLTNSDVTVFFCEILPRLSSGVGVYVDDIFLPWDYPEQMHDRWYSEQYVLAAWLLAGDRLRIDLPNFWIATEPELHGVLAPLWNTFTWAAVPTNGTGFWMTVA